MHAPIDSWVKKRSSKTMWGLNSTSTCQISFPSKHLKLKKLTRNFNLTANLKNLRQEKLISASKMTISILVRRWDQGLARF